jgi:hypothetical protein
VSERRKVSSLDSCLEMGKEYTTTIDREVSPRNWRSMVELDCGARTCSDVKNLRVGSNLYHGFKKLIRGSWR